MSLADETDILYSTTPAAMAAHTRAKAPVPNSKLDADHPRVALAIDSARPYVNDAHVPKDGTPFLFLSIGGSLDLWSHDPAAFRRLAAACVAAAEALERAQPASPAENAQVASCL